MKKSFRDHSNVVPEGKSSETEKSQPIINYLTFHPVLYGNPCIKDMSGFHHSTGFEPDDQATPRTCFDNDCNMVVTYGTIGNSVQRDQLMILFSFYIDEQEDVQQKAFFYTAFQDAVEKQSMGLVQPGQDLRVDLLRHHLRGYISEDTSDDFFYGLAESLEHAFRAFENKVFNSALQYVYEDSEPLYDSTLNEIEEESLYALQNPFLRFN